MKLLKNIDSLILSYVQLCCDRVQRFCGVDNFYIAKCLLLSLILIYFIFSLLYIHNNQFFEGLVIFGVCLFVAVGGIEIIFCGERSCVNHNIRNILEQFAQDFRMCCLFLFPVVILSYYFVSRNCVDFSLFVFGGFCKIGVMYFASCTPNPPPSQSELDELWERWVNLNP